MEMKANALHAGYAAPSTGILVTDRVRNGIASLRRQAASQVMNLMKLLDCPIETEADRHYAKCLAACFASLMFPPLLAVAAYQMFQAKAKEGGKR